LAASKADHFMSWGTISASADDPKELEKLLNEASDKYFAAVGDTFDDDGKQQAHAAAAAVKTLVTELKFKGAVDATISGHFGVAGTGVPSGVAISIVDLAPPPVEREFDENEQNQAENGENSAENGQN
jgi:hypothetical protein